MLCLIPVWLQNPSPASPTPPQPQRDVPVAILLSASTNPRQARPFRMPPAPTWLAFFFQRVALGERGGRYLQDLVELQWRAFRAPKRSQVQTTLYKFMYIMCVCFCVCVIFVKPLGSYFRAIFFTLLMSWKAFLVGMYHSFVFLIL